MPDKENFMCVLTEEPKCYTATYNRGGTMVVQPGMAARFGGHIYKDIAPTLQADATGDNHPCVIEPICLASSADHAEMTENGISPSLMARAGTGGNQLPLITEPIAIENDITPKIDGGGRAFALRAREYKDVQCVCIDEPIEELGGGRQCFGFDAYNQAVTGDVTMTLLSNNADTEHIPTVVVNEDFHT